MQKITGKIVGGMGKGAVLLPAYTDAIKDKLCFIPFPGTLNVEITEEERDVLDQKEKNSIHLEGKGSIALLPITIQRVDHAAIVFPEKTKHPRTVIEIIADAELKKVLYKKEQDIITWQIL